MDGVLIIDKEKGYTSNDVVAKLRGILRQRKIGHAGTLDPDATGVLVVLLGRATKLSGLMMSGQKCYRAGLRLGITTDTQDTGGTVLSEREPETDPEKIREAILSFQGEYDQIPPMYSALKVNGRKLYQYARSGQEVLREARKVTIESIAIEAIDPPFASFTVECSKGTYVRTLCHDIGQRLGCGAAMESLCRVRSGSFTLEDSVKIGEVRELFEAGRLEEKLIGLDRILEEYPVFVCDEAHEKALLNGNRLAPAWGSGTVPPKVPAVVKDSRGNIRALYRLKEEDDMLHPDVMLL
ncbi:MAG: tRNA pseudouridine(55) synthase TruB [Lachnospiraceae bacterium]|nr:tRNA pseudouridine(55) synthase TruB [Lachnospiraceae bacterium]